MQSTYGIDKLFGNKAACGVSRTFRKFDVLESTRALILSIARHESVMETIIDSSVEKQAAELTSN